MSGPAPGLVYTASSGRGPGAGPDVSGKREDRHLVGGSHLSGSSSLFLPAGLPFVHVYDCVTGVGRVLYFHEDQLCCGSRGSTWELPTQNRVFKENV